MSRVYDRILVEIGNEDKYQKRFDLIHNTCYMFFWGMAYTNMLLALTITPHTCKLPEKPVNVSAQAWKLLHIPNYGGEGGRHKFDECRIYSNPSESNDTKACEEFIYDKTWYDTTVSSEYNWICDKELNIVNILGYSKIGEIIGSCIFGWFGDTYGRRLTYFFSTLIIIAGRLISLLSGDSYIIFLIGCVIANFPSWSAPQTVTVISTEISSARRRTITTNVRYTASSIALVVIALVYWWSRNWKTLIILTTAPLAIFLIISWYTIESPRWLYTRGRYEEAAVILRKIAKVNKKQINEKTEKEMTSAEFTDDAQVLGPIMLFSGKKIALHTFFQMLIWAASNLSFVVLLMSSGEKTDGNPFLDFAWQAIVDIPSIYLAAWISNKAGRRFAGISSFSTLGTMWACIALRENSVDGWIRQWWVGSLFTIVARIATSVGFVVINLFNIEIHPTCLRQSGMALGNTVSGICAALAPYVIYLGRRIDSRLPGVILTSTSILGAFSSFMLPETLNVNLPETLEEAKLFGKKEKKNTPI